MFTVKNPINQSFRLKYALRHSRKLSQNRKFSLSANSSPTKEIPSTPTSNKSNNIKQQTLAHHYVNTIEFCFDSLNCTKDKKNVGKNQVQQKIILQPRIKNEHKNSLKKAEYLWEKASPMALKKQQESARKQKKINQMLKPFKVNKITLPQQKQKKAQSYISRPKTSLQKSYYLGRGHKSSEKMRREMTARQKLKMEQSSILPWGEDFDIIQKF